MSTKLNKKEIEKFSRQIILKNIGTLGQKKIREANLFWMVSNQNRVFLQRRPLKGLLPGMLEFPSSEWINKNENSETVILPRIAFICCNLLFLEFEYSEINFVID